MAVQRSRWRVRVNSPEGAEVPVEAFANRLEDLGGRLGRRVGLGQNAGRLILRRQSPFGLLAKGDVVKDDHSALQRAILVAQGSASDQDPRAIVAAGIRDIKLGVVDRLAADRPDQRKIINGIGSRAIGQEKLIMARPIL